MIQLVLEMRVLYLCSFTTLLQFVILPTIIGQYVQKEKQQFFDFTEGLMSLIMSSIVGACALASLYSGETVDDCYIFHLGRHLLVAYLISHSLYWVIHQKFQKNTYMWLSHHFIAVIAVCLLATPPANNLQILNAGTLLMEVSNPINNLVFLLLHLGFTLENSHAYKVLCALWILAFSACRIAPMPYVMFSYLDCFLLSNSVAQCTNRLVLAPLLIMYTGISILNLYWFRQMMQGVWDVITGKIESNMNTYKSD
jgi:hypothetical protein